MPNVHYLHPGATVTVYATPAEPKRVSVANAPAGALYYEGADTQGTGHKYPAQGSVVITDAFTFVGGSVISVEGPDEFDAPKPKPAAKRKSAAKKATARAKRGKGK